MPSATTFLTICKVVLLPFQARTTPKPVAPSPSSRTVRQRRHVKTRRSVFGLCATAVLIAAATVAPERASANNMPLAAPVDSTTVVGVDAPIARASILDSLRGRSMKLRARFISPSRVASLPILRELFGETTLQAAAREPSVLTTAIGDQATNAGTTDFHFITMRPFADKVGGRIGAYRIGVFPGESRTARQKALGASYGNPEGFLEVTADNQDTQVSENFRLRDFLTHDQVSVWPKYLVLREPLIDKLELVIDELRAMGVNVKRVRVMSGFRTPQYNAQGVGAGGRVQNSRHQYGDAADVYIMNGTRDWMSDLDRDGKITIRDARLIAQAADRVEKAHPDLVGGVGLYPATSAHGPFVHIDVRGTRARWGGL